MALSANTRWAEMLSEWAIPDHITAQAPAPPYFFDPKVFIAAADEALSRAVDTPSDRAARAALPPGGSLLDVACGAGAASLRLRPNRVVGVDPNTELLEAFAERAGHLGIEATAVEGTWPQVASEVASADVVVCHHVVYNVPDLAPFVAALDEHARYRVVIELTATHPMAWMAPYWEALHHIPQPERPIANDAAAVLEELGFHASAEHWKRRYQMIGETSEESLSRIARRLCLPAVRHDELRRVLDSIPPLLDRDVVTLWW